MLTVKEIGRRVYDLSNPREKRRYYVYLLRAMLHKRDMQDIINFFAMDPVRSELLKRSPFPVEQITRAFFYNRSTFAERKQLVEGHFSVLQAKVKKEVFWQISDVYDKPLTIWENDFNGESLCGQLVFEPGQRKEGLSSLQLNLGKDHIYQVMFWLGKNGKQEECMWIGALQGPNMDGAKEVVKKLTKACHGYRTKNLAIYMMQAIARVWNLKRIYAVSNYGYYANNHMRSDRKLKTNFCDFWEEVGGVVTEDNRFYELPLTEKRKTMEEVPTRKRAVYRRRFAFLDEVDTALEKAVKDIMN